MPLSDLFILPREPQGYDLWFTMEDNKIVMYGRWMDKYGVERTAKQATFESTEMAKRMFPNMRVL